MSFCCRRAFAAALTVTITFFYPLLAPTPHRIDEEHFKMLTEGMSRAEVELILGVPPGKYDFADLVDPFYIVDSWYDGTDRIMACKWEQWTSRSGCILAAFDGDEVVVSTTWLDVQLVPPWEKWRRRMTSR